MSIIIIVVCLVVAAIGMITFFLFYSSVSDVSEKEPYNLIINTPLEIKQKYALRHNSDENLNRFHSYYISPYLESDSGDSSILKVFNPGETITFSYAKEYFSYHVGSSPYLIGNTTLPSGENIRFEYATMFEHEPAIWETLEEYLKRRESNLNFPIVIRK